MNVAWLCSLPHSAIVLQSRSLPPLQMPVIASPALLPVTVNLCQCRSELRPASSSGHTLRALVSISLFDVVGNKSLPSPRHTSAHVPRIVFLFSPLSSGQSGAPREKQMDTRT